MKLYLSKTEKLVLFKKYKNKYNSTEEANKKLSNITEYLRNLVIKLTKQKKTPEEIDQKFREEFEKICQKAEV